MSKWYFTEIKNVDFINGELKETGKSFRSFDSTKMIGYDAICRVESYIKKHQEIKIIRVDDEMYAGSRLVFVPHPDHGITMIFIPQCSTNTNQWFLYPSHLKYLSEILENFAKDFPC